MTFADIELDEDAHEVFKAGQPVELSPTEFKLLRFLMANQGRVLSKAQILDHVWHYDFGGEATVVESYISYLRRKIDTTEPRLLHTVRGVGYVLRVPAGVLMPGRLAARLQATPLRSRLVGLLLAARRGRAAPGRRGHGGRPARVPVQPGGPQPHGLCSARSPARTSRPRPTTASGPPRPGPVGPDLMYVRLSDPTGTSHEVLRTPRRVTDPPALPDLTVAEATARPRQGYVVDSESGDTRWRVVSAPLADGSGSVSVAQDIGGIDATVNRLILIELAIGAIVLLVLGITGRILVRRSLRPLGVVEETAAAIAAGDLDRRAPASDPRTEVGSLAHSFNTMVDDLAGALAAQQASELAARESAGKAEASEARMRQFVADAGHELRTPLTSVRGFAELYRIGAVDQGPALDDAMSRIEAEAARMGVLVDDLLLLARLDQQRPLEITDVDVVDLVTDAVAAARAAAPDREVAVHVTDPAVGLCVPGDPLRLRQVVDNLLSNALRYSPADQPVEVRIGALPAGGRTAGWATIAVVDHGAGMPPEVAARVFERFYRADAARSRAEGGSGLGLSIVAAIVAAHGGRVDLDTAVGPGVPVHRVAAAAVRQGQRTPARAPAAPRPGRDRRSAGYSRPASCTRRRKSRVRWSCGSCSSDLGRSALDDGPGRQEADLVGHLLGEAHLVGGDDHGHPLGLELAHGGQDLVDQDRVQRGGHLVHEHQPG